MRATGSNRDLASQMPYTQRTGLITSLCRSIQLQSAGKSRQFIPKVTEPGARTSCFIKYIIGYGSFGL